MTFPSTVITLLLALSANVAVDAEQCVDDYSISWLTWNATTNEKDVVSTCSFITDFNMDTRRGNFCGSNALLEHHEEDCPVSCGLCPDKDDLFFRSNGKACSDFSAEECQSSSIRSSCPVSCDSANFSCADEGDFTFKVRDSNGVEENVPCTYITANPEIDRRAKYCSLDRAENEDEDFVLGNNLSENRNIMSNCYSSCGLCPDEADAEDADREGEDQNEGGDDDEGDDDEEMDAECADSTTFQFQVLPPQGVSGPLFVGCDYIAEKPDARQGRFCIPGDKAPNDFNSDTSTFTNNCKASCGLCTEDGAEEDVLDTLSKSPKSPKASTKSPKASTKSPKASTKTPKASTKTPKASTKTPKASTKTPKASTKTPKASTKTPKASTKAPKASTKAPKASTKTPKASTKTPKASTKAPKASTKTPTTKAPKSLKASTMAPVDPGVTAQSVNGNTPNTINESGNSGVVPLVPIFCTFAGVLAVGLALIMYRRSRNGQFSEVDAEKNFLTSSQEHDNGGLFTKNLRFSSKAKYSSGSIEESSVTFPVSTNGRNNEFEVAGGEI
jgi:hypothetical protein